MIEKDMNDKELDAIFDVMKETAPRPPADLMSRVQTDAMAVQAGFRTPPVSERVRARQPGIWQELFRVLGGWPAMAGLATATVAGVWLGAFPPGFLPDLTGAYLGTDNTVYLIDTADGAGFDLAGEAL